MRFTTIATELIELQKFNLASSNSLRESLFSAAAKSFDLNAAAYRYVLQQSAEVSQNFSDSMNAQDLLAICLGCVAPALEQLTGYARDAYIIASGTGVAVLQIAEMQVARFSSVMAEFAEIADPDSPLGSTSTAWMIRGIVNTAQSGLEAGLRTAQQTAGWADTYFGSVYPDTGSVTHQAAA